ncbi:hypothetical protein C8Q74DRAFT_1370900 [Fomes fomentarius]|nr:hypothetical protein C8Q74DRAFT_1370900 [Fomes fomentarius]
MSDSCTPNACSRLSSPADYGILLASPTVQVVELSTLTGGDIAGGFAIKQLAKVADGQGHVQVLLVEGLRTFGTGKDMPREVRQGDVIKIERMLRVPYGNATVVLVHDIEICSDDEVDLVIINYEEEINRLKKELTDTRARLAAMLDPEMGNRHITAVLRILDYFDRMVEQAMANEDEDMADQA